MIYTKKYVTKETKFWAKNKQKKPLGCFFWFEIRKKLRT